MLCDDLARNLTQSLGGVLQFQLAARTIFKVFIVMRCIAPCVAMFFHSSRYNKNKEKMLRGVVCTRATLTHIISFLKLKFFFISLAPNTT